MVQCIAQRFTLYRIVIFEGKYFCGFHGLKFVPENFITSATLIN